jgi:hypothetical protein
VSAGINKKDTPIPTPSIPSNDTVVTHRSHDYLIELLHTWIPGTRFELPSKLIHQHRMKRMSKGSIIIWSSYVIFSSHPASVPQVDFKPAPSFFTGSHYTSALTSIALVTSALAQQNFWASGIHYSFLLLFPRGYQPFVSSWFKMSSCDFNDLKWLQIKREKTDFYRSKSSDIIEKHR